MATMFLGGIASAVGMGLGAWSTLLSSSGRQHDTHRHGAQLQELRVQSSRYGQMIPELYGTMRIAGNVIYAQPVREVAHSTAYAQQAGKGGRKEATHYQTSYSYHVTLAVLLCAGPIDGVLNIWADADLLPEAHKQHFRIYKGSEEQMPDSALEAAEGLGMVPAYRGLAYIGTVGKVMTRNPDNLPIFCGETLANPLFCSII